MPLVKEFTIKSSLGYVAVGQRRVVARISSAIVLAAFLIIAGCDTGENPLRPYEGERPFVIQNVTQSWRPDVQWVGGRAAAIGVNLGEAASLDSSLVWLRWIGTDEIDSPISINDNFDADAVVGYGGEPMDSLASGATYTLWIASEEALDADLDTSAVDEFAFVDTTFDAAYQFVGRSFGGARVQFTVVRNETLLGDEHIISWTPNVGFRQLAIRNAASGGFTNLLWHIVMPDDSAPEIHSPVVVGEAPPGAVVGTEWNGWAEGVQTIWATTDDWDGNTFGFTTPGYAFFQALASNFE